MDIGLYKFSIWTIWISFLVLHPLIFALNKSPNANWGNFWTNWLLVTVITGIIVGIFLLMPNQMSNLFEILKNLVK